MQYSENFFFIMCKPILHFEFISKNINIIKLNKNTIKYGGLNEWLLNIFSTT